MDRKGGVGVKNSEKIKCILKEMNNLKEAFQVNDIWRLKNPDTKRFTWRRVNPMVKSRLDYWFISKALEDYTEEADIIPSINTDHSAVTLYIKSFQGEVKGKGTWRLNNSFLEEEPFCNRSHRSKKNMAG